MRFKINPIQAVILTCLIPTTSYADNSTETLSPIIVTADLRETSEQDIPASVDVITQAELQDQGITHLDDILLKTVNVNYSGQSSRARHIQIRGIGERDEYTGAPNSSIGLAIDDIDFSGIGMTSNLFDTKQVEVLRGPQSTRYGASALGGLINIKTNDPQAERESLIETTVGQDNLRQVGVMTTGAFSSAEFAPQYRIAIQKTQDNGFRQNNYLNRDDTNKHDELNARAKFRFLPNSENRVDLTLMHANLDNGYDAWSLDNSFTTLSDQPGKDTQKSSAMGINIHSTSNPNFVVESKTSIAHSDMIYAYDGDWVYPGFHTNVDNITIFDNAYYYQNKKERQTLTQDIRLTSTPKSRILNQSTDWLLGFYGSKLSEQNHTTDNYGANLISDYAMNKLAAYGQLDIQLDARWTLSPSLRIENNNTRYTDNNSEYYSPNDTLWGGGLSLTRKMINAGQAYASISRGYKAGGFNIGLPSAQNNLIQFKKESLINYEIGHKATLANNTIKTDISVFYMDRKNPQFDGYSYVGNNYVFYKENFDSATNYGLEANIDWIPKTNYKLFASLGLLQTDVKGISASEVIKVSDRDQAHAPSYQYTFGFQYRGEKGIFFRADTQGMDSFYFSNTHSYKSNSYAIYNAQLGYEGDNWEAYLWGKNLTDERYATRGYHFANEPTYSVEKTYIKLGDPRQLGITARVYF
ncbi:TonB-dependent receptor [Thiomicrorhabdus arctica]|uniref:TonB-dependent receptor n=1 Tax=Thiomicrorhabdus arctica TaxID=131540 RepID=UPI00036D6E03|nr:TonB-dependent receptor [Thiomicrorhabdus arctica]